MTAFDLLFILAVLASAAIWILTAAAALRRSRARAWRILRIWVVCALLYLAAVAADGLASPRRVLKPGDPWCFDDWCLIVERVTHTPEPPQAAYTVSLRIFSRARRVSQRAKGAWIYVIDRAGRRYAPEPDNAALPLDVLLQPGESVSTSRTFKVPPDATGLALITGHGFPYWCRLPIIGDDSALWHQRTVVRLQ
ncbi:MAG TPA: hypothetical protein VMT86_06200 [Bryobacteraceae bacterium]|nr:hypothetical protein [Bryobacteraceae bacterium]